MGAIIHSTANIDSSAQIAPSAIIAEDVSIGPWTVVGEGVEIGPGTTIASHCVVQGPTRIGRDNHIHPFCSIGGAPQDKKYSGEETLLEIGDGNTIRESCTLNRGTMQGGGKTRIGHDNWIMAYVHVAHDCVVGDHTILANGTTLAGHVRVEDYVIFGAFTVVHQFCAVGTHAFTAMGTVIFKDVPPYVTVSGNSAVPHGINTEGLRRRGFNAEVIREIRRAYKTLYKQGHPLDEAKRLLAAQGDEVDELRTLVDFLRCSERGIVR